MISALAWFGFRGGVGAALGALLMAGPAYVLGSWNSSQDAAQAQQITALKSQIAARDADLRASRDATKRAAEAAAQNAEAAAAAQIRIENYAKILMARGDADRCRITDDDRLQLDRDGGRPNPAGR